MSPPRNLPPALKRQLLGQHLLTDATIVSKIVETVAREFRAHQPKLTHMIEIGPGAGALTHPLTTHPQLQCPWLLVEKDDRLAQQLSTARAELLVADFLRILPAQWIRDAQCLGVASNLPYSAGTAILLKLLESKASIGFMVLMFQKEVAQRILAEADDTHRGSLSLWIQNEWDVSKVLEVPPAAFRPPPKVDSTVLLLKPRALARIPETTLDPASRTRWDRLLKKAFAQRRQMLRRIFKGDSWFEKTEIDGTLRAQSLTWEQWGKIARAMSLGIALGLATAFSASSPARANMRDTFGLGSGLSTLQSSQAMSAENNPALLARGGSTPVFRISYACKFMRPSFLPISNVVVSNDYVADTSPSTTGTVDNDYLSTFGHILGVEWSPWPSSPHNISFGITTYAPLLQLGLFDSGEAYLPEYILFRARTQRPEISIGTAARWDGGFSAGAGLRVSFSIASRVTTFIKSQSAGSPSSMRITSSVSPQLVPFFGARWESPQALHFETSLVARAPALSSTSFSIQSSAQVIGDLTGLSVALSGSSTLFYDPASLEWGVGMRVLESVRLMAQLDYQVWRAFRPPAMALSNATTGGGISIAPSANPSFTLQNVLSPRAGVEWAWGDVEVTASYAYRPSIYESVPTGTGNLLDPPRHTLFLAAERTWGQLGDRQWTLQVHLQAVLLVSQTVTKTAGDESGNLSKQKIGSPGYTAGGWLGGGGISLGLAL